MTKIFLFIILMFLSAACIERPLVIGFSDLEPCVMFNDEHKPYGFDIDLFNRIAEKIKLTDYQYREVQFKNIFYDVKAGYVDLGIGGITITSKRERAVDFTHPYLQADIKALAKAQKESTLSAVFHAIYQTNVRNLTLIVLCFSIFMGIILAFVEKRENTDKSIFFLIFDYTLFTLVTISTVGYGDRTAKTIIGKNIVMFIILVGLAIFGCYVGTITANIQFDRTVSDINCMKDLRDKPIATVEDTYASDALCEENLGSKIYKTKDLSRAFDLLKADKVSAIVFDAPPLLRYASKNPGYMVAPFSVRIQNYGFVVSMHSPWRVKINQALLELQESGEYQKIYDKWF